MKPTLTDGVDVEEVHRRAEDGVEHAVVQRLCAPHQHVEQEQVPHEAEDDRGSCQTCRDEQQNILLGTVRCRRR